MAAIREVGSYLNSTTRPDTTHLKSLDTGDEFSFPPETSDLSIRLAFADTILRFLSSLPEALVPASLHSRCVSATDRDDAFEVTLMPLYS